MIVSDLYPLIRRRWADEIDRSYTDTILLSYANEAIHAFATITGCNQDIVEKKSIDFESSLKVDLSLSDNITGNINVKSVYDLKTMLAIPWSPYYEFIKTSKTGNPKAYTVFGEYLILDAIPNAEGIEIWMSTVPETVTGISTLPIPEMWHLALVCHAEYRIRSREREGSLADRAYDEFLNHCKVARSIYGTEIESGGENAPV